MQSAFPPASPPPAASPRSVGLTELFTGFLSLGLMSFGGALPFARRTIVDERKWLSADEFTDLLGLCQFLPGGNVINLSVAVGMRFRGVAGAFAGILGLIAGPTLVVVALGVLYAKTQNDPRVQHLFAGLAAAAAGLLVAMAVKVAKPLLQAPRAAAAIAVLAFVAIAVLRMPLLTTMLVLTPVSIWLASRRRAAGTPRPAPAAARGTHDSHDSPHGQQERRP
ncbi:MULTISPECIES: chromate transporter [Burkholderia]|uniref:chromate transporter n=1 Tax=Burkholderia TaxID=32008 RepID=UPI00075A607B|nr:MULTISPECIES: chromate transporter [Burkholderia]KVH04600.1 chromate transporter [Burkholderia anthina]KVH05984.1 chromate transporter [Burkholderia anthina]KVM95622.1 chromate transporter [Burkholderia anthina]KVN60878.1 chromate transporter [Burkholderia anthina]KVX36769.1 chromate transporter [Burkholderia anthina]